MIQFILPVIIISLQNIVSQKLHNNQETLAAHTSWLLEQKWPAWATLLLKHGAYHSNATLFWVLIISRHSKLCCNNSWH